MGKDNKQVMRGFRLAPTNETRSEQTGQSTRGLQSAWKSFAFLQSSQGSSHFFPQNERKFPTPKFHPVKSWDPKDTALSAQEKQIALASKPCPWKARQQRDDGVTSKGRRGLSPRPIWTSWRCEIIPRSPPGRHGASPGSSRVSAASSSRPSSGS